MESSFSDWVEFHKCVFSGICNIFEANFIIDFLIFVIGVISCLAVFLTGYGIFNNENTKRTYRNEAAIHLVSAKIKMGDHFSCDWPKFINVRKEIILPWLVSISYLSD